MTLYVTRDADEAGERLCQLQDRAWAHGQAGEVIERPETPFTRGLGPLYVVRRRPATGQERAKQAWDLRDLALVQRQVDLALLMAGEEDR